MTCVFLDEWKDCDGETYGNASTEKVLVTSILCFLVVVPLAFFWFAKGWGIPGRPPNMYIRDEIEVLPESLEVTIIQKNDDLFDETGGEIAIVTVGSVGSRSIEDYAEKDV